jgi:D-psicose/D-tagatose/L-ribulose 3-epimerase
MKIGFNMFLWTGHVTEEHQPIMEALKRHGYDGVQIPVLEGEPSHYGHLKGMLDDMGLDCTALTIIPEVEMHPLSDDPNCRKKGLDYLKWALDCTAALGTTQLCGPVHQTLGYFTGSGPTETEVDRAIEFHRQVGDYAQASGITVVLEAINRFECYFVNTMEDLCSYLTKVDHPAITGMYDTFHANLEEKHVTDCIGPASQWISHVHISENDRGTPGKGHIDWATVFRELKSVGYDGWLTIEAFSRALPQLAAATMIWRDLSPSLDEVWKEGYSLIRKGWDAI